MQKGFEGSAKTGFARNARKSTIKLLLHCKTQDAMSNRLSNVNGVGWVFARKKNEKKCEACRKEGRYGSPQMAAHSKREPPKVSINNVLKIADKDGTTYGKAVLAHNI